MPTPNTPERPDLQNEPVAFSAVKQAGVGALLGAAVSGTFHALQKNPKTELLEGMAVNGAMWAAIFGATQIARIVASNQQKDATRPYVERLEQQIVANNLAADNSVKR